MRAAVAVLTVVLIPAFAAACMWDYDTIKMERTRFPSALELITGKFLRHSPEFYEWRIADRLRRLESDPANVALLDDLAVAYDKTGRHDRAIETAERTERLRPGRYETAANLGTFLFHAGRLADGLPHVERALRINPDAHFGREKYQKLLVEYVLTRRNGGPMALPLAKVTLPPPGSGTRSPGADVTIADSFAHALGHRDHDFAHRLSRSDVAAAVKGVLGMMKFGSHDSPVLLEALGGLLVRDGFDPLDDAKQLAARAFLRASYEVPDGPARQAYRGMAERAIDMQVPRKGITGVTESQVTLAEVEAEFQKELAEGREWYAALREREIGWIRDGRDPEAEFDALYAAEPEVAGMGVLDGLNPNSRLAILLAGVAACVVLTFVIAVARTWRIIRRRRFGSEGERPV